MTDQAKQTFLVLYNIPVAMMDDWAKTDPAIREPAEARMRQEWGAWMGEHARMITLTNAVGKSKRVTSAGATDARNDIILYALVEAESQEAAAKAFESHPHLQIPQSSIEVMAIRPM
jgi:hypothetical protein